MPTVRHGDTTITTPEPKERIEKLTGLLRARFPSAAVEVETPAHWAGTWRLDLSLGGRRFVIEFNPNLGFGLSTGDGDRRRKGPDAVHIDEPSVVRGVAELLEEGTD